MAYDTNELFLVTSAGGGAAQSWIYEGTDLVATVAAANYISDASDRGMRVGDTIEVRQFATTAKAAISAKEVLTVEAVASTGATLGTISGTATATAGAATLNAVKGKITSEALTTAAAAEYTLTLTNSQIAAADIVLASVDPLTSAGSPGIGQVKTAAGSAVITVTNLHASAAFDAAIAISFVVIKA